MHKIPEEALIFLKELEKNNNREWFNERKPKFKALEQQVKTLYGEVERLLNKHDIIEKTKPFRIYRDIRFSKDKTPYKTYYSVVFRRKKPALRGGYYLHIQPGDKSFLDTGFWNPAREELLRVRKEWEIDTEEIRELLENKTLQKYWGKMWGEQLKTAPMGFNREDPNIDLINYKQWLFQHRFTDKEVLSPDFAQRIDTCFKAIRPFFDYMSSLLTTDLNGVSLIED